MREREFLEIGKNRNNPWRNGRGKSLSLVRYAGFSHRLFQLSIWHKGARIRIRCSRRGFTKIWCCQSCRGLTRWRRPGRCAIKILYADRADMPLEKGEYFIQDLIGLTVVDADTGEGYGTLSDVSQTGANDVYHISKPGKSEKLIPAIRDVVVETDLDGGIMRIRPLKGTV